MKVLQIIFALVVLAIIAVPFIDRAQDFRRVELDHDNYIYMLESKIDNDREVIMKNRADIWVDVSRWTLVKMNRGNL